jgi:hypothetical protein
MSKPKKPENERAIKKTITVMPHHQRHIEENTLNLSKFVQKKIDEEIDKKKR